MSKRPTNAEASAFHDRADNTMNVMKPVPFGGPMRPQQPDIAAYRQKYPAYPDYYYPDDKEKDTYYQTKLQAAQRLQTAGVTPQYPITDDYTKYLIAKKDAQEMANFKLFCETSIPRGTPWARDFFEKIMPGWYQSKVDIINEKIDIMKRLMDMTVKGVQSIDDMFILWNLSTGRVGIPANFQDLMRGADDVSEVEVDVFTSGLFNPSRWANDQTRRLSEHNRKYLANLTINGVDMKGLVARANVDGVNIAAGRPAFTWGVGNPFAVAANENADTFVNTNLRNDVA